MTNTQQGTHHRIVVGIDGSEASSAVLEWATRQAALTGSTLEVVITWEWPTSLGWTIPLPSDFDPAAEAGRSIEGFLATARSSHPEVTIESSVTEGHPAPTLVEASHRADLLVVGSRGHGEFAGMLLGSVSEHCAHHAKCPVVIVH